MCIYPPVPCYVHNGPEKIAFVSCFFKKFIDHPYTVCIHIPLLDIT